MACFSSDKKKIFHALSLAKALFNIVEHTFFADTAFRRDGRVVMQGTATPRTAVRFRFVPPFYFS